MKLLAVSDLVFGSRIRQAAAAAGVAVAFEPRDGDVAARARELRPGAVLLDLTTVPEITAVITSLRAAPELAGVTILGYVGHAQVDLAEAARAAGADEVYSKGELTRELPELMRRLAARPT